MDMYEVESSNIGSIGYDPDNAILVINFKNGGATYEYYDVPQHVFDELLAAESKGRYANSNIYKAYRQQRVG